MLLVVSILAGGVLLGALYLKLAVFVYAKGSLGTKKRYREMVQSITTTPLQPNQTDREEITPTVDMLAQIDTSTMDKTNELHSFDEDPVQFGLERPTIVPHFSKKKIEEELADTESQPPKDDSTEIDGPTSKEEDDDLSPTTSEESISVEAESVIVHVYDPAVAPEIVTKGKLVEARTRKKDFTEKLSYGTAFVASFLSIGFAFTTHIACLALYYSRYTYVSKFPTSSYRFRRSDLTPTETLGVFALYILIVFLLNSFIFKLVLKIPRFTSAMIVSMLYLLFLFLSIILAVGIFLIIEYDTSNILYFLRRRFLEFR